MVITRKGEKKPKKNAMKLTCVKKKLFSCGGLPCVQLAGLKPNVPEREVQVKRIIPREVIITS